ncbi:MAG: hypothetical protein QXE31_05240 [Candidatus Woesearchaeota archaeon]
MLFDIAKTFLERAYGLKIPIFFIDYGIIIISLLISPFSAMFLVFYLLFIRIITADFKVKHLLKIPLLIFILFIAPYFRNSGFVFACTSLFALRYIIEHSLFLIFSKDIKMELLYERIINTIFAFLFFALISPFIRFFF